jgi:ubiquitin-like protein ATG12
VKEGVFCYVNSVFAPGLDEGVGGLWKCFKTGMGADECLVVGYSLTPAFG